MKWAINHRDEHVRADAPGVSYSLELRCPVCRERVFPRSGRIREAHFAHYGGNSSKACEQYHPGEGVAGGLQVSGSSSLHEYSIRALGAPALLWKDEQSLPTSLYLRLPSMPGGFSSNIKVISRATSQFRGGDLAKAAFAGLRLQVPPGQCETTPHDPALEELINEVLSKFRFSGNFFRATSEGGVLEPHDFPLELGENYWLVTQAALREPVPELLHVHERRSDRAWFAYRIALLLPNGNDFDGLAHLRHYLQREIIRPLPRVSLIWPTPERIDPDGVPVFHVSVAKIFVRSTAGVPKCVVQEQLVDGKRVAEYLFSFDFDGRVEQALIGAQGGPGRQLRFEACNLVRPAGVYLHVDERPVLAFDPELSGLLEEASAVRVEVPSHRLWRNVRVNGLALRPLPDGTDYAICGQLLSFSAGSFGLVAGPRASDERVAHPEWFASIEGFVAQVASRRAAERLRHIKNKGQLLRWGCEFDAQALLPKLLSLMSGGVARGVS